MDDEKKREKRKKRTHNDPDPELKEAAMKALKETFPPE